MNKVIYTDKAPAAIGPYSQAILAGNTLYVSGQLPVNPATGNIDAEDIAGQARQSLTTIKHILEEADHGYNMRHYYCDHYIFTRSFETHSYCVHGYCSEHN